jgi:hypothetical protein
MCCIAATGGPSWFDRFFDHVQMNLYLHVGDSTFRIAAISLIGRHWSCAQLARATDWCGNEELAFAPAQNSTKPNKKTDKWCATVGRLWMYPRAISELLTV